MTIFSIFKRLFIRGHLEYPIPRKSLNIHPCWIAGMFMLFKAKAFESCGGFDENFFLYCEDADICLRLKGMGYEIIGCTDAKVVHDARRYSMKKINFFFLHLKSAFYFFLKHGFF